MVTCILPKPHQPHAVPPLKGPCADSLPLRAGSARNLSKTGLTPITIPFRW